MKNITFKSLSKNISFVFFSNSFLILTSVIVTFLVPKFIEIENFSLWQLYLYYSIFVGFFHFGFNDGILIKYSRKISSSYNDNAEFSREFILNSFMQFFWFIILILFVKVFINNHSYQLIYYSVIISMLIVNTRIFALNILQSKRNFVAYSFSLFVDRLFFVIFIILVIFFRKINLSNLIILDLVGKFISLLLALYFSKIKITFKLKININYLYEYYEILKVGFPLMLSNFGNLLIIGFVRFFLELKWGIVTFGIISYALSISNLIVVFATSIGQVLFNYISKSTFKASFDFYISIRTILISLLILLLFLYYPLAIFIELFLPTYANVLNYLPILFPIIILDGLIVILVLTYLKANLFQLQILKSNLVLIVLSLILSLFISTFYPNLILFTLLIPILLMIKIFLYEKILFNYFSKSLQLRQYSFLLIIPVFIYINLYFDEILASIILITFSLFILFLERKIITRSVRYCMHFLN